MELSELLENQPIKSGRRDTEDYERGLSAGADMDYVSVAINNVWGGVTKSGGSVSSYEKIGYHAGSVDFLLGVIDAGCPVTVYRSGDSGLTSYLLEVL